MANKEIPCPDCGWPMKLRPYRYGQRYECVWPGCNGVHHVHQRTGKPLGTPANAETRRLRSIAHGLFDKLWQSGDMTRNGAYHWLACKMKLNSKKCHFAMFDKHQCEQAIRILKINNPSLSPKD